MGYKAKNFAFTHLAGSLAADGLTFTVTTGTGSRFPTLGAGDFTYVVLESAEYRELVKVVEISGDTFTIAADGRGYESTTPRAWVVGTVVRCCLTAGVVQEALMLAEMLDDHEVAADPHPQYATSEEVTVAVAPALNTANGALQKSGGTMTGPLTLSGDATDNLHAVPKQQLDTVVDVLRDIRPNPRGSAYTLALSDRGMSVDAQAPVTIPESTTVAFPVGSTITVTNVSGAAITIGINIDTLRMAGTTKTGTRTLAGYGVATVRKIDATTWIISGAGLS